MLKKLSTSGCFLPPNFGVTPELAASFSFAIDLAELEIHPSSILDFLALLHTVMYIKLATPPL